MKNKLLINIIVLIIFSFIGLTESHAALTEIPTVMSVPVVLKDEADNILVDGDYAITINLNDYQGNTVYSEEQIVTVLNGITHINFGEGYAVGSSYSSPAGGLSYDVFNVEGDISVEILVDGQASPQEVTILGSQPYSFIAQYALSVASDSITTSKIKDGTITEDDLDSSLINKIENSTQLVISGDGESDSDSTMVLTAKNVSVSSDIGLNNASGNNVHEVLQGLDNAIDTIRSINIESEISQISDALDDHTSSSSVHGVTGNVVGTQNSQTLTNKTLGSGTVISSNVTVNDEIKVDGVDISALENTVGTKLSLSGGTMAGPIDMNSMDITNIIKVDGTNTFDLSDLESRVTVVEAFNASINMDDPTFGKVTIEDTPSGDPEVGTLYKNNMILAWARIDGTAVSSSCTTNGIVSSFNIECIERYGDPGSGRFHIYFKTNPVSGSDGDSTTFYIVNGTGIRPLTGLTHQNGGMVLGSEFYTNYFKIWTGVIGSGCNGYACMVPSDFEFMVMVVGGG